MPDHQDRHGRPRRVYRAAEQPPEATPAGKNKATGAKPAAPARANTTPGGTAPKNTKKTGQKTPKNTPKNLKEFWKQNQRNILVGGGIALLVVVLLLVMLIPGCSKTEEEDSSLSTSIASEMEVEQVDAEREPILPIDQLQGTILGETEDAGQEYIDDTLFLGDSNTVRMLNYRDVTGVTTQNAVGVVGMGIQSVTTYKCVKYEGHAGLVTMPEAVAITQPRRVVITFGTNNVGGMGVDTFIGYYKDAIEAIQESYEYADIIIGAVFPVDANCSASGITLEKIDNYNIALAELAEEMECKFLYWSEAIEDTTGYAISSHTVSDGYHISRDGMEALFDYYRTHAHISEDNRPTLKPVPKRLDADVDLITTDGNTTTVPGQDTSMLPMEEPEEVVAQSAVVSYGVWDNTNATTGGGTITVNGGTYTGYTYDCMVGETAPGATANPASGYRFSHWSSSVSVGSSSSFGSFTVNSASITITAVFEQVEAVTVEPPTTSEPPAETAPPATEPPPTTAPPTTAPPTTAPPTTAPPATDPPTTAPPATAPPATSEEPATEPPAEENNEAAQALGSTGSPSQNNTNRRWKP